MSAPMILIIDFSSNVDGKSVLHDIAAMYGRPVRPCFLAQSTNTSTAAAAPSVVGQHWKLVSVSKIIGDARISSTDDASRNCERSLATACLRFLAAILASCSLVVPYFFMC